MYSSGKLPVTEGEAMDQTDTRGQMRGKVVMLTGANAGMGKEIALGLAAMGATLVMVRRDRARGEAARADVEQKTGNHQVELLTGDLSSHESIRRLRHELEAPPDPRASARA